MAATDSLAATAAVEAADREGRTPTVDRSVEHGLARTIHECRREAFETEARRGFSPVRPTQAHWQYVEDLMGERAG